MFRRQGARILRNEAYYCSYAAMTTDTAQHSIRTFYEAVNKMEKIWLKI